MANATYQLSITCTHYNQFVENVMCFQGDLADGSQPLTEGRDLIDSFMGEIMTQWLSCLPPTVTIDRLSTRCLLPGGPSQVAHLQVINMALTGGDGSGAASENLCPAVNLIPPMGVKSGGRVYMPCVAKESVDNNQFVAGYRTAINATFEAMRVGFANSATTWKLAIFSKKNGTSSLTTAHSLSAALGYQGRRRKPL